MFPEFHAAALIGVVLAYLVGSVSFAVVVSRAMGLADPHTYGSGNPGATNVLRTGNRKAAALTLIGDAGKGAFAVGMGHVFAARYGLSEPILAWIGLAAFVGHLFPVFHRFAGGKGVATAAGVLLALSPWLGLFTLATWLTVAVFLRYSSLAALVSAVFAPFFAWLLMGVTPALLPLSLMGLLLIARHRSNIAKLLAGQESRIGDKKKPAGS
jgi:glycerol-3-phosphate acyltransferase PlsY